MSIIKYTWCMECHSFKSDGNPHEGHSVVTLGNHEADTIAALDDLIQFGQDSIAEMESRLEKAREVEGEITSLREKFKNTLGNRIERIVKDLRVALDEHSMQLLSDVDKRTEEMEANAKTVIRTFGVKLDTGNSFLMKATITLPDDDGNFNDQQLKDVYNHYKALEKIKSQQQPTIKSVAVNIKFPNTMKVKTECRELSKRIIGEIENNIRPSLLDAQRPSIDVANINEFGPE